LTHQLGHGEQVIFAERLGASPFAALRKAGRLFLSGESGAGGPGLRVEPLDVSGGRRCLRLVRQACGEALRGDGVVFRVKLDAEIIPPQHPGSQERTSAAGEGVEHQATGFGKCFNQRQQDAGWFLRSLIAVY
jgi:hypothetical protein